MNNLMHLLRPVQVFQAVQSKRMQCYLRWQPIPHQFKSRLRNKHLAAIRNGLQARGAIEGLPKVVVVPFFSLARVQSHSDLQWPGFAPLFLAQRQLRVQNRVNGFRGCGKGGTKRIANGLEHIAVIPFDGFPEQNIVAGKRNAHSVGATFP